MNPPQVKEQEGFLSQHWPVLLAGGLLLAMALGPAYLYYRHELPRERRRKAREQYGYYRGG